MDDTGYDYWKITGLHPLTTLDTGRAVIATVKGSAGKALARGCEAVLNGYVGVRAEGTLRTYKVIDPADDNPHRWSGS